MNTGGRTKKDAHGIITMFQSTKQSHRRDPSTARKPPPNYLSRREQMRLLVLVGSLMLVIILMFEAADPTNWEWLWAGPPQELTEAEIANKTYETRLAPAADPERSLMVDEFISELPDESVDDVQVDQQGGYFPGVKPRLLATVRDDMLLIPSESDAFYHLCAVLRDADAAELQEACLGRKGFVQLYEQPKEYRGRLVTIRGEVRHAEQFEANPNSYGVETLWKITLRPAGGPNLPIIVYALEMPLGFPEGADIHEEAAFTGFSYKRAAYQAKGETTGGETRTAPVVIAKIGHWNPPPEKKGPSATVWAVVTAVIGAAILAAGLAMFVYLRSVTMADVTAQYHAAARAGQRELAGLEKADLGPGVNEKLQQIAAEHDRENS